MFKYCCNDKILVVLLPYWNRGQIKRRRAKIVYSRLRWIRMKILWHSVCKYGEFTSMENWQEKSQSELHMTNLTLHNFVYLVARTVSLLNSAKWWHKIIIGELQRARMQQFRTYSFILLLVTVPVRFSTTSTTQRFLILFLSVLANEFRKMYLG
jgi:hypothetical protein